MKKLVKVACLLLFYLNCTSQINAEKIHLFIDYNNGLESMLDGEDGFFFSFGGEYSINEVFSVNVIHTIDRDNYIATSFNSGLGIGQFSKNTKYSNKMDELFVGLKMYPVQNYHSQSLHLRNKENYGFYFNLGYSGMSYRRGNIHLEHFYTTLVDSLSGAVITSTDSVFVHHHKYKLIMSGMQFGFGWKEYHSKFIYTDISIVSSAYRRENTRVTGSNYQDPDRYEGFEFFPESQWTSYLQSIKSFSKNGRGFVFLASVGINLDFR